MIARAVVVLAVLVATNGVVQAVSWRQALARFWGPWFWVLVCAVVVAGLTGAIALLRPKLRRAPVGTLRGAFSTIALGALGFVIWLQPFSELGATLYLAALSAAFCVAWASPWRPPAALDFGACTLAASAVLLELALRLFGAIAPNPLLTPEDASVVARIAVYRAEPGTKRWGFPCNALGHYDEEFAPRSQREGRTVAVIGDSFSSGTVPHAFHYTTVGERESGTTIYNFGFPSTGLQHYLHLLRTEVMATEPDAIVIALFVGNDLGDRDAVSESWMRGWLDRDQVRIALLTRRLATLADERAAAGRDELGTLQGEDIDPTSLTDLDAVRRAFPFLDDPSLEQPSFSAGRYAAIELNRARHLCENRLNLEFALESIDAMRAAAGEVPFAIMMIPDAFQVDDLLWAELATELRQPERDQPQRMLRDALTARGIPFLDLLPAMRAVPIEADGLRHLYLLRDTHINARGNAVVGRELATFLERLGR